MNIISTNKIKNGEMEQDKEISTDLSKTEFVKCVYKNIDFTKSNFLLSTANNCVFEKCIFPFQMQCFSGVGSEFIKCEFINVNLSNSQMNDVVFNNCEFVNVVFNDSNLTGCSFSTSKFYGIISFQNAILENIQINWKSHSQIGALLYNEAKKEKNHPNKIGLEAYSLWMSQQSDVYCSSLYDPKSKLLPEWYYEWGLNIVSKYYNGTNEDLRQVLKRDEFI